MKDKNLKAFVLAGGLPQIELLKQLKERNIYTVLADWNEEPIAKNYADKFYQASTLDINKIEEIARNEKVDFLITVCTDQALLTVAYVSEKLNLPCYINYDTARKVTNKKYMKKVFEELDIPSSKFIITENLNKTDIIKLKYPLVVKPVDCNSSKGVKKVENYEELEKAFYEAKNFSRTNTAIIEEYFSGQEISVDVYVENGVAKILSACNVEKIKNNDKFIIYRTQYPISNYQSLLKKIKQIAQKIADAFQLKHSPMLIQMLTDGENLSVIEFSARTGGGIKYDYIKYVSGFDVISAVIDLTLGNFPQYIEKNTLNDFQLVNTYLYCHKGVYEKLDGFKELKEQNIIHDYFIFKPKGSYFDTISSSGDRIACVLIQGKDNIEIKEKHKIVFNNIKVLDNQGKNILNKDIIENI